MINCNNFLRPISLCQTFIRNTARYGFKHNKNFIYKNDETNNRVVIEGRISYYPRFPNETPPSHEPSKLFRVTRIKRFRGLPHWEKRILRDMGLYERSGVAIVKNIPENNARLWKVKHLIRIEPITFPHGEPTENDINHTFLKESGECIVVKEIGQNFNKRIEAAKNIVKDPKRLTPEILKDDSRKKWQNAWFE